MTRATVSNASLFFSAIVTATFLRLAGVAAADMPGGIAFPGPPPGAARCTRSDDVFLPGERRHFGIVADSRLDARTAGPRQQTKWTTVRPKRRRIVSASDARRVAAQRRRAGCRAVEPGRDRRHGLPRRRRHGPRWQRSPVVNSPASPGWCDWKNEPQGGSQGQSRRASSDRPANR